MRIENLPKKKSWVLRRTQDLYRLSIFKLP
jgi:hypothetical protein